MCVVVLFSAAATGEARPAPAAPATVTTAAARMTERRLSAPAMTSPTYSLAEVLGASWKQASPHRKRQVRADRPPGCDSDEVLINGNCMRTLLSPCFPLSPA